MLNKLKTYIVVNKQTLVEKGAIVIGIVVAVAIVAVVIKVSSNGTTQIIDVVSESLPEVIEVVN